MTTTSSGGEPGHALAHREIVVSRAIGAPRELVFEAFTQIRHLSRWWGPEGFHDHDAFLRVPRRRGLGLRDARTGSD